MAQSILLAPFRALFQKDIDFEGRWGRRAFKYIAWALIGAAAMAILFYAAPALLPALAIFAAYQWVAVVGFGLLAGLGLGMVATGLRESMDALHDDRVGWKGLLRAYLKVALGFVLGSPLLFVFGLYQGMGLAATAGYMVGAAAVAFMGGMMVSSFVGNVADRLGYTPGEAADDDAIDSVDYKANPHPIATHFDGTKGAVRTDNPTREERLTLLKAAIDYGDAGAVKQQLKSLPILADATIESGSHKYPLLVYAVVQANVVRKKDVSVVKAILEGDPPVNAVDSLGNTALHRAVMYKDGPCVKAILAFQPRSRMPALDISVMNTGGLTAWELAQVLPQDHDVYQAMQAAQKAHEDGSSASASTRPRT